MSIDNQNTLCSFGFMILTDGGPQIAKKDILGKFAKDGSDSWEINDEMSIDYQKGLEYKQNIWIENEKNSNSDGFTLVKKGGQPSCRFQNFLKQPL